MTETTAADVINAVPGIEKKAYLELGVQNRVTFDNVHAMVKVGVDIEGGEGLVKATTDDFFDNLQFGTEFDVIYIDADHRYEQVVKDYNNAIIWLRRGGLILLHDMYPPDESFTSPNYCGDAYKLLVGIMYVSTQFMVLDHNFGLTVVFDAKPVSPRAHMLDEMTYDQFVEINIRRHTGDEMLAFVASR